MPFIGFINNMRVMLGQEHCQDPKDPLYLWERAGVRATAGFQRS